MKNVDVRRCLSEIIHQNGLKILLEELIDIMDGDEDYIVKLREGLQTALDNYNNRYNDKLD